MSLVALVATVVFVALILFIIVMWVRLVVDWIRALRPGRRPTGMLLVLAEVSFAVTDPAINLVRRVVKPVRFGGARLDFAWSIVLILCLAAIYLVGPLRYV